MTTLVIQTPQEPTDSSLPIDYRDSQLNAGSLLALDFRYSRCAPGASGPLLHATPINNLLDGGVTPKVFLNGVAGSATYSIAGKRMALATTNELVQAQIVGESTLGLAGAKSFGVVLWCKISMLAPALTGSGKSLMGFEVGGVAGPNKTPGLLLIEKRRRNLTAVDTAADSLSLVGHGLANGDRVEFGGTLPGGLAASTLYYVVGATADAFKVSSTRGGAAVDLTSAGSAYVMDNVFRPKVYSAIGGDSPSSRSQADPVWDIAAGETVQLAFGWSVENGLGRATLMINGGAGKIEATSAAVLSLPANGFGNFAIGIGLLPYRTDGQPADLTVYRALLEDLTVSGRSLSEMAQADWVANSAEILAR